MTEQPETIPRHRRACECAEPDPVMQADRKFYCYRCSFETGARPTNLPELEAAAPLRVQPSARELLHEIIQDAYALIDLDAVLSTCRCVPPAAALLVPPDHQCVVKELTAVMGLLTTEINIWLAENHHLPQEEQVGYPPFHLLKIQKQIEARIATLRVPPDRQQEKADDGRS